MRGSSIELLIHFLSPNDVTLFIVTNGAALCGALDEVHIFELAVAQRHTFKVAIFKTAAGDLYAHHIGAKKAAMVKCAIGDAHTVCQCFREKDIGEAAVNKFRQLQMCAIKIDALERDSNKFFARSRDTIKVGIDDRRTLLELVFMHAGRPLNALQISDPRRPPGWAVNGYLLP